MSRVSPLPSPFSQESRLAWEAYLLSPAHSNRYRLKIEKPTLIHKMLRREATATGDKERKLKYVVKER